MNVIWHNRYVRIVRMKIFAERLKELRTKNNLSQNALANILNVSRCTIARWEKCKGAPNSSHLREIAKYFKIRCNYLLGLED